MENTKPNLKFIVKSRVEMITQLKTLCKKFLWSPHGSASSDIALNSWRGLNKIPWRKYEIEWSKSITKEPASAVGKSPVILPIISPANTCVCKVIWSRWKRIKKFSSPKFKIWFEPTHAPEQSSVRGKLFLSGSLAVFKFRISVRNFWPAPRRRRRRNSFELFSI